MSPSEPVTAGPRPLRRDAAANRERLLEAAGRIFARDGVGAGVEEIAREAGVGIGTLYRRFPTKEALIAELVGALRADVVAMARAQDGQAGGLEAFLVALGELVAGQRGFLIRLWSTGLQRPSDGGPTEAQAAIQVLLDQACATGSVRHDVSYADVVVAIWALRGIVEEAGPEAPEAWRRHLDIVLAGLRPGAAPLSHPAASAEQLQEATRRRDTVRSAGA